MTFGSMICKEGFMPLSGAGMHCWRTNTPKWHAGLRGGPATVWLGKQRVYPASLCVSAYPFATQIVLTQKGTGSCAELTDRPFIILGSQAEL